MIYLIHRRDVIKSVPTRWKEQYPKWYEDTTRQRQTQALDKLDLNTCSPEDIKAIIGNDSWTENECHECKRNVDTIIFIGDEPDYDAKYVQICADCLGMAHQLMTQKDSVE